MFVKPAIHAASRNAQQASGTSTGAIGKCPHGYTQAMCSACSGGGGGGGSRPARQAGLMNWAEAYAAWFSIQSGKRRTATEQTHAWEMILANRSQAISLQFIKAAILAFSERLIQVKNTLNLSRITLPLRLSITKSIATITNLVRTTVNTVATQFKSIQASIRAAVEQLVSILGEQKKRLQDILESRIERWQALLAKTLIAERWLALQESFKNQLREWISQGLSKLKEDFYAVLSIIGENLFKKLSERLSAKLSEKFSYEALEFARGKFVYKSRAPSGAETRR